MNTLSPLEKLRKWLKKAKDQVDSNVNPRAELIDATSAATELITLLNQVLPAPEPSPPASQPTWTPADWDEAIGACLGALDHAEHLKQQMKIAEHREAVVVCRWSMQRFLDALPAPLIACQQPGTLSALDKLKKWLEEAKKKVDSNQDPSADLGSASTESQAVIQYLAQQTAQPVPLPPSQPLDAGTSKLFMNVTMAFFGMTESEYDEPDLPAALDSCVDCKWAIDSFVAWLGYYDKSNAKKP